MHVDASVGRTRHVYFDGIFWQTWDIWARRRAWHSMDRHDASHHSNKTTDSLKFPTPALLGCYRDMLPRSETLSPEALTEGALRRQKGGENGIISAAGGRLGWTNRAWPCSVFDGEIGSRAVVGLLHSSPMFAFFPLETPSRELAGLSRSWNLQHQPPRAQARPKGRISQRSLAGLLAPPQALLTTGPWRQRPWSWLIIYKTHHQHDSCCQLPEVAG